MKIHKKHQERRLAHVAVAAGTAFGITEGYEINRYAEKQAARRKLYALALPVLCIVPLLTSVLTFWKE